MRTEREFLKVSIIETTVDIIAVIGLWLIICGVEKLPGFKKTMNFV